MVSNLVTEGEPAMRASEAQREQAAELLRTGYAEGRLTRAELDERLTAAYAARTVAQLSGVTADLHVGLIAAPGWRFAAKEPGDAPASPQQNAGSVR